MATPSGTQLYNIYDQIRVDIFGTNDDWTATAASGFVTSVMDIYAQKVASRINGQLSQHNYVRVNTTTGGVTPAIDQVYALLETGITALIRDTEVSLLKRLASGLGITTGKGEGSVVKNADSVNISTALRYQERIRAFLGDRNSAKEDFKTQLRQFKYDILSGRKRYVY